MKRFAFPLLAMALPLSAFAQDTEVGPWHGGYAGLQLDYLAGGDFELDGDPTLSGEYDGVLMALFIGYRYQFDRFVVGGEYDLSFGQPDVTFTGIAPITTAPSIQRLGAEFGYDAGRVLPYATAGYTFISFDAEAGRNNAHGGYFGIGMDYRLREFSTIGVELLHHSYGDLSLVDGLSTDITTLGISYGFDF